MFPFTFKGYTFKGGHFDLAVPVFMSLLGGLRKEFLITSFFYEKIPSKKGCTYWGSKYRKNSKNWDTLNSHRDCPTNGIVAFYSAILRSKDSDRITNRVDTDQTAP